MRIHSDTLTPADVYAAARAAGPGVGVTVTRHGSRSRSHALDVKLTGTSSRRPNSGNGGRFRDDDPGAPYAHAATWDEWGMFLARLFDVDPAARCWAYPGGRVDFDAVTRGRFDTLTPDEQHRLHRWDFDRGARVLTCACGAEQGRIR